MSTDIKRKIIKNHAYNFADNFTEILIFFIVIFSPWAFGTTEAWSIWTMNITAYALGFLLVIKIIFRHLGKNVRI